MFSLPIFSQRLSPALILVPLPSGEGGCSVLAVFVRFQSIIPCFQVYLVVCTWYSIKERYGMEDAPFTLKVHMLKTEVMETLRYGCVCDVDSWPGVLR